MCVIMKDTAMPTCGGKTRKIRVYILTTDTFVYDCLNRHGFLIITLNTKAE